MSAPNVRNLLDIYEHQFHRMGVLWERHQGKGWPKAASDEFARIRDELVPANRAQLLAAATPALQGKDIRVWGWVWKDKRAEDGCCYVPSYTPEQPFKSGELLALVDPSELHRPLKNTRWPLDASAPAAPQAKPDRTGMTYYKKDACKAPSAEHPDCICWAPAPQAKQQPREFTLGQIQAAIDATEDPASGKVDPAKLLEALGVHADEVKGVQP